MLYEKMLVDTYPGFLSLRNEKHQIVWLNSNFKDWVAKYTNVDPIGKINTELAELVPDNVADTFLQCHDGSLDLEKDSSCEGLKKVIEFKANMGSNESSQYFDVLKYKVDHDGKPYIFTIAYDVTNLYLQNQKNLYSSLSDVLTNTKNRRYFEEHYYEFKGQLAGLFDLDNFKLINDKEGHLVGDQILKEFATFMEKHSTIEITVIRLGGDEFLIVFGNVKKEEIQQELTTIREVYEKKYLPYRYLSFSFGLGIIDEDAKKTLTVLDEQLYIDKNRTKKRVKEDR